MNRPNPSFVQSVFGLLLVATPIAADNCGSLSDCYQTAAAAAASAAALAAALALATLALGGSLVGKFANTFGGSFPNANWRQAAIAGFGMAVNALGMFVGAMAFALPSPGFVTQALGVAVIAKSAVGFAMNAANFGKAFSPDNSPGPSSISEWAAKKWYGGNPTAQGLFTAIELGLDLAFGAGVLKSIQGSLGAVRSETFGAALERVYVRDLGDLGTIAKTFVGADIINTGLSNVRDILRSNGYFRKKS